ncbi:MAG: glycine--tRNA ligase subunit beta [Nitrospira sp.]
MSSKAKAKSKAKSAGKSGRPAASASTPELLLEIGTEELPYQFVAPALRALHEATERLLKEERLSFGTIRVVGTPRRLVVLVDQLATHQAAAVKETMGPSKVVAFDQAGQPTKAAIGFATGQGVPVEKLEIRSIPKGEYVFAVKQEPGQAATTVLAQQLPKLIGSLTFPKAMHWNQTGVRFARPIRWLVALCHGKALPIEYAGLVAEPVSYGHRFVGRERNAATKGFVVRTIAQYLREAERHGVIVEQDRRRTMILEQLVTLAESAGGVLHHDDELVEQAVYAVEYPHAILGSFQPHYLSLPKEVLMTSMKEHQGFFALVDRNGALLPNFLAVTNMKLSDMRLIREGNERVLSARLADAKFFFDEDRKIRLADRVEKLAQVTFYQKLGSLHQKTTRNVDLSTWLTGKLSLSHRDQDLCQRAAQLSKADLITGMVGEFPTLQGIIGAEYARHDGEAEEVCKAIRDQYLPRGMDGELPATIHGQIVSLADRIDTIVAFFRAGVIPKGSEDPFALRRHALSIVRILIEGNLRLDLNQAVDKAGEIAERDITDSSSMLSGGPLSFIFERVRFYAGASCGIRDDIMAAVCDTAYANLDLDLTDVLQRMKALQTISARSEFDPLIIGFKRAHRLCEKEQWDRKPVNPELFGHQAEVDLYQALQAAGQQVKASMEQGDYAGALDVLVRMKEPIDAFFAGVMVNADDTAVRGNRLSLLKDIDEVFMTFADFSQIMVQGS